MDQNTASTYFEFPQELLPADSLPKQYQYSDDDTDNEDQNQSQTKSLTSNNSNTQNIYVSNDQPTNIIMSPPEHKLEWSTKQIDKEKDISGKIGVGCSPIIKWTNNEVVSYINEIGLNELEQTFRRHSITGKDLLSLTKEEIKNDLNITNLHWRKKLLRNIQKLKDLALFTDHIIKVMYFCKEAKFRIPDPRTYSIKDLLDDCIHSYDIKETKNLIFKDQGENILPFKTKIIDLYQPNEPIVELYLIHSNFLPSFKQPSNYTHYTAESKLSLFTESPLKKKLRLESMETDDLVYKPLQNNSKNQFQSKSTEATLQNSIQDPLKAFNSNIFQNIQIQKAEPIEETPRHLNSISRVKSVELDQNTLPDNMGIKSFQIPMKRIHHQHNKSTSNIPDSDKEKIFSKYLARTPTNEFEKLGSVSPKNPWKDFNEENIKYNSIVKRIQISPEKFNLSTIPSIKSAEDLGQGETMDKLLSLGRPSPKESRGVNTNTDLFCESNFCPGCSHRQVYNQSTFNPTSPADHQNENDAKPFALISTSIKESESLSENSPISYQKSGIKPPEISTGNIGDPDTILNHQERWENQYNSTPTPFFYKTHPNIFFRSTPPDHNPEPNLQHKEQSHVNQFTLGKANKSEFLERIGKVRRNTQTSTHTHNQKIQSIPREGDWNPQSRTRVNSIPQKQQIERKYSYQGKLQQYSHISQSKDAKIQTSSREVSAAEVPKREIVYFANQRVSLSSNNLDFNEKSHIIRKYTTENSQNLEGEIEFFLNHLTEVLPNQKPETASTISNYNATFGNEEDFHKAKIKKPLVKENFSNCSETRPLKSNISVNKNDIAARKNKKYQTEMTLKNQSLDIVLKRYKSNLKKKQKNQMSELDKSLLRLLLEKEKNKLTNYSSIYYKSAENENKNSKKRLPLENIIPPSLKLVKKHEQSPLRNKRAIAEKKPPVPPYFSKLKKTEERLQISGERMRHSLISKEMEEIIFSNRQKLQKLKMNLISKKYSNAFHQINLQRSQKVEKSKLYQNPMFESNLFNKPFTDACNTFNLRSIDSKK